MINLECNFKFTIIILSYMSYRKGYELTGKDKMPAVYLLVIPNSYDISQLKDDYVIMKRLIKIYHTRKYEVLLIKRRYHDMYVEEYVKFISDYYNVPIKIYKTSFIKSKNIPNYVPRFLYEDIDNEKLELLYIEEFN